MKRPTLVSFFPLPLGGSRVYENKMADISVMEDRYNRSCYYK